MQALYESRAIKHTVGMVRIPAAALKQQLQQLIHHSLDTDTCICTTAGRHTHTKYKLCVNLKSFSVC